MEIEHYYQKINSVILNEDEEISLINNVATNLKNPTSSKNIDNKEFLELKIIEAEGQWIKKNQLEELQYDFSKKSILGNKKVYIINGAEKLNVSSSNSLLKFLDSIFATCSNWFNSSNFLSHFSSSLI